jgi:hypothetical protein
MMLTMTTRTGRVLRAMALAHLLTIVVVAGVGVAVGAGEGFVFGFNWTVHAILPGGNGAPGPEVIPALSGGILAAGLGAVAGGALFGAVAELPFRILRQLRRNPP